MAQALPLTAFNLNSAAQNTAKLGCKGVQDRSISGQGAELGETNQLAGGENKPKKKTNLIPVNTNSVYVQSEFNQLMNFERKKMRVMKEQQKRDAFSHKFYQTNEYGAN